MARMWEKEGLSEGAEGSQPSSDRRVKFINTQQKQGDLKAPQHLAI